MGKQKQSSNKNKSSAASQSKAEKAAAKKAAKAAQMEEMWDNPAVDEASAAEDSSQPAQGALEQFDGDPFQLVEEFDGDAAKFGKTLFGGLSGPSKADVANTTNRKGMTLLHTAVEYEYEDLVPTLLANGADVNLRNKQGKTPLHLALEQGSALAAGSMLGDPKLDPNSYDKAKTSLLIASISARMWGTAQELLSKGADAERADRQKNTPLHALCMACLGSVDDVDIGAVAELMKSLVEHGAQVDTQAYDGRTALMMAAGGKVKAVRDGLVWPLLELGADPKIVSKKGNSAADLAKTVGDRQLAEQLVQRGAQVGQGKPEKEQEEEKPKEPEGLTPEQLAAQIEKAEAAIKKANAHKSTRAKRKKKAEEMAAKEAEVVSSGCQELLGYCAVILAILIVISIYLDPGGPDPLARQADTEMPNEL